MQDTESRAVTAEELRDQLLDSMRSIAQYWASTDLMEEHTVLSRVEGAVFSVLSLLDGCSDLPGFEIVARPHEDDKQYHIDEGDNWIEDGTSLGEWMLHEHFYKDRVSS